MLRQKLLLKKTRQTPQQNIYKKINCVQKKRGKFPSLRLSISYDEMPTISHAPPERRKCAIPLPPAQVLPPFPNAKTALKKPVKIRLAPQFAGISPLCGCNPCRMFANADGANFRLSPAAFSWRLHAPRAPRISALSRGSRSAGRRRLSGSTA